MFSGVSVPAVLSGLAADAVTVKFDLPSQEYDRLHSFIESKGLLPESRTGRVTLIAMALLASRIVKQLLGNLGPVANFANELGEDAIREQAKRILETVADTAKHEPTARGQTALWDIDDDARTALVSLYGSLDGDGRARMHRQLVRMTALDLASMARLTPEQLHLLLELLSPPLTKKETSSPITNGIRAVNGFLFPWMRTS